MYIFEKLLENAMKVLLLTVLLSFPVYAEGDSDMEEPRSDFGYARLFTAKIPGGMAKSLEELEKIARKRGTVEIVTFRISEGPEGEIRRRVVTFGSDENRYPGFKVRARKHLSKRKTAGLLEMSKNGTSASEKLPQSRARIEWRLPLDLQSPLKFTAHIEDRTISETTVYEFLSPTGQKWPKVVRIDLPHREGSIIQIFEYLDDDPEDTMISPERHLKGTVDYAPSSKHENDPSHK